MIFLRWRKSAFHLDSGNKSWTKWQDWFLQLGYDGPIASGVRVNNYSVALQAAEDSAGIALGWQRLLRPLLAVGRLSQIGPYGIEAPHRFHLVGRPDNELSDAALQLKRWIVSELQPASGEPN